MMKKTISLLLVFLMIASLSVLALADEEPIVFMPEGTNVLPEVEQFVAEEAPAEDAVAYVTAAAQEVEAPAVDGLAAMQLELKADAASVPQTKTLKFTLSVKANANPFCAVKIGFSYDKNAFTFESADCLIEDANGNSSVSESVVWYDMTGNINPKVGDKLVSFTLKAKETATIKTGYSVGVTVEAADYSENWVTIVDVTPVSIEITEKPPYIVGDVDESGDVNKKDVAQLARYLGKWGNKINLDAADIDGDKSVTKKDLSVLKRYLGKWTGYDSYFK